VTVRITLVEIERENPKKMDGVFQRQLGGYKPFIFTRGRMGVRVYEVSATPKSPYQVFFVKERVGRWRG